MDPTGAEASTDRGDEATVADGLEPEAQPAAQAPGGAEPQAPADEPDQPEGFDSPFSLEDVPEEYREHVERYNKQLQGAFTSKTQELAAERKALEGLRAFQEDLENPETRDHAIRWFLEQNDLAVLDDDAEAGVDDEPGGEGDLDVQVDPTVRELESAVHTLTAKEREREFQGEAEAIRGHVNGAIEEWAKTAYAEGEQMPARVRDRIIGIASITPLTDDGLPNMEAAIAQYEADRAAEVQEYLDSKRVTTPQAGGEPAVPAFNPTNDRERLDAAMAIAGRHL